MLGINGLYELIKCAYTLCEQRLIGAVLTVSCNLIVTHR